MEEDQEKYQDYERKVIAFINDFLASQGDKRMQDIEIDQEVLKQAIHEKSGIPVLVSRPDIENTLAINP